MESFFMVIQFIVSIALIAVILLQKSKGEGLGSIGGGAQMFFDQSKGLEATLEKATTILAVTFMILSLVLTVL